MVCRLDALPTFELPQGYGVRHFTDGDDKHWDHIIFSSFVWYVKLPHFARVMSGDVAFEPRRVLFITHGQTPIATASAWWRPAHPPTLGYLHYVAALDTHRGLSLGLRVSLACMYFMKAEGRTHCLLHTDDFRLPALHTYLKLGFEPVLVHENQRQRWLDVFAALKRPSLAKQFADILSGPVVLEGSAAWRGILPSIHAGS